MTAGYSLLQVLIAVVIVAGAVAIVYVVLERMGVAIPEWVIRIFWILVVAVVAILALKFLFSLG
jgi:uncharacterized protein (DUF983 family)